MRWVWLNRQGSMRPFWPARTALTVDDDQLAPGDPVAVTFAEPASHTDELFLVRDHASCRPGWLLTPGPQSAPPVDGSGDYLADGKVVGGRKQRQPWIPLGSLGTGTRGVQLGTAPTMTVQVPTGAESGDYLLCAYALGPMSCAEVTLG